MRLDITRIEECFDPSLFADFCQIVESDSA